VWRLGRDRATGRTTLSSEREEERKRKEKKIRRRAAETLSAGPRLF